MALLPELTDPTLDAADAALEESSWRKEKPRGYLGMSALGHDCARKLWYGFRWVEDVRIRAKGLKAIADGFRSEEVQAERLRLVDGVTLQTVDPQTGRQFAFEDLGGHLRGHCDGQIVGLLQAPKTWHVWEHKATNETKWRKLLKLKDELGEKEALRKWDAVYYAQAILYMHYSGLTRHYLTVSTPGCREVTSCRTEEDPKFAAALLERARGIVFSEVAPGRIGDANFWVCKLCDHRTLCHQTTLEVIPKKNCRTCIHATVGENGKWSCASTFDGEIPFPVERYGCERHLFLPSLIPGEQEDAITANGETAIFYRLVDGRQVTNIEGGKLEVDGTQVLPESGD